MKENIYNIKVCYKGETLNVKAKAYRPMAKWRNHSSSSFLSNKRSLVDQKEPSNCQVSSLKIVLFSNFVSVRFRLKSEGIILANTRIFFVLFYDKIALLVVKFASVVHFCDIDLVWDLPHCSTHCRQQK